VGRKLRFDNIAAPHSFAVPVADTKTVRRIAKEEDILSELSRTHATTIRRSASKTQR
jgi:hypothetical protein